jgi:hypothetical protein
MTGRLAAVLAAVRAATRSQWAVDLGALGGTGAARRRAGAGRHRPRPRPQLLADAERIANSLTNKPMQALALSGIAKVLAATPS